MAYKDLLIGSFRGGRNGYDPPHALPEGQCAEAFNVDFTNGATLGRKRRGSTNFSLTGFTSAPILFLGRHVPSVDPSAAELWGIDNSGGIGRFSGGAWSTISPKDSITGDARAVTSASFKSKFFLTLPTAVDRLYCWDSNAGIVRRTGLVQFAAAPTVADTGAGAYAATQRYYRCRSTEQQSGVTVRRSEPSASVAFTPSGAGTAARVTRPTAVNENETHWEVEVSLDNATFYVLSTIAIATTTYDDSAATTSYASNTVSDVSGTYGLQKAYRYIAVDQARLLGFGSFTSTDPQNTIEFSAVDGSLNIGDVERVTLNSTLTLDEKDSGPATGLVGPINGKFLAFKLYQTWLISPTGDPVTPFQARPISKSIGTIDGRSVVLAEDETGNPAIYWMSHIGPYRYGRGGLEYLAVKGGNIRDLMQGPTSTLHIYTLDYPANSLWHGDQHQVWMFYRTSTNGHSADGYGIVIWDAVAGAWSRYGGELAKTDTATMYRDSTTSGAIRLKPYVAYNQVNGGLQGQVWKADADGTTDDNARTFQAYATDRVRMPFNFGVNFSLDRSSLLAVAQSGVTITQTLMPNYGAQTALTSTADLTPAGSETRVAKTFEDAHGQDLMAMQLTFGDSAAVANAWQLDEVRLRVLAHDDL